jgi:hypothetical protein
LSILHLVGNVNRLDPLLRGVKMRCAARVRGIGPFDLSLIPILNGRTMPRGGAYTVSDLPLDRLCQIACTRCGRAGAYRRETLSRGSATWCYPTC